MSSIIEYNQLNENFYELMSTVLYFFSIMKTSQIKNIHRPFPVQQQLRHSVIKMLYITIRLVTVQEFRSLLSNCRMLASKVCHQTMRQRRPKYISRQFAALVLVSREAMRTRHRRLTTSSSRQFRWRCGNRSACPSMQPTF